MEWLLFAWLLLSRHSRALNVARPKHPGNTNFLVRASNQSKVTKKGNGAAWLPEVDRCYNPDDQTTCTGEHAAAFEALTASQPCLTALISDTGVAGMGTPRASKLHPGPPAAAWNAS